MKFDLSQLVNHLNGIAVGYGPVFRDLQHATSSYPPHNIITVSDNEFILEMAVAGFKKHEINIFEDKGVLTITADKDTTVTSEYQYRGIATRSFSKNFRIAEYFDIDDATLEDGILAIRFVKNTPEVKPKRVMIK